MLNDSSGILSKQYLLAVFRLQFFFYIFNASQQQLSIARKKSNSHGSLVVAA